MYELIVLFILVIVIAPILIATSNEQDQQQENNQDQGQEQSQTQPSEREELNIVSSTIPISDSNQVSPGCFAPINENQESFIQQATDEECYTDHNLRSLQESYQEDLNNGLTVDQNGHATMLRLSRAYLNLSTLTAVRPSAAHRISTEHEAGVNPQDILLEEQEQGQPEQTSGLTKPEARGTGGVPDDNQASTQNVQQLRENDLSSLDTSTYTRTPTGAEVEPNQSNNNTLDELTAATVCHRPCAGQHGEYVCHNPQAESTSVTSVLATVGREDGPQSGAESRPIPYQASDEPPQFPEPSRNSNGRNGRFDWIIHEIGRKKEQAKSGQVPHQESEPFFTSEGYKMSAKAYLNGEGIGAGSHVSLYFNIRKSDGDWRLQWPFKSPVTMTLVDQETGLGNISEIILPDSSPSFQKPTEERNIPSGISKFVPLDKLNNTNYIKDDMMLLEFKVGQNG